MSLVPSDRAKVAHYYGARQPDTEITSLTRGRRRIEEGSRLYTFKNSLIGFLILSRLMNTEF